jgi:hypothetical protein
MGGIAFWVSVFPTDVMKSRIQVATHGDVTKRLPYFTLMLTIIRQEGKFDVTERLPYLTIIRQQGKLM